MPVASGQPASVHIYMPNNSSIPQIQTGVPSAHTASSSGTTPCSPAVVPQPAKRRKKKREHVLGDESSALVPQPPQKRPRIETCQNNAGSVVPFGEYELQQLGHQAVLKSKVRLTRKTHPMVLVPEPADYTPQLQRRYIESSQADLTSVSANITFPAEKDFNLECLKTIVLPKAILIDEFLKLDSSTGSYAQREWHYP